MVVNRQAALPFKERLTQRLAEVPAQQPHGERAVQACFLQEASSCVDEAVALRDAVKAAHPPQE